MKSMHYTDEGLVHTGSLKQVSPSVLDVEAASIRKPALSSNISHALLLKSLGPVILLLFAVVLLL